MNTHPAGVVIFPGAGSSSDHSSLKLIEQRLAPLAVRRADFNYRLAGKKVPDRAPVLLARVREVVTTFAGELGVATSRLVIGGRSMGGRMCSMAAAGVEGEPLPVAGLVLISYPLHPPGKPDRLRVEHLPQLTCPSLFIQGSRDTFGSPDELRPWLQTIPGAVTTVVVEGKGHDLKGADGLIADALAEWLNALG